MLLWSAPPPGGGGCLSDAQHQEGVKQTARRWWKGDREEQTVRGCLRVTSGLCTFKVTDLGRKKKVLRGIKM